MKKEHGEVMELSHDAVPGYRPVFYVVLLFTIVYLVYIIAFGGDASVPPHAGGAAH